MGRLNLKRIKVSSLEEIALWLRRNDTAPREVMFITLGNTSGDRHIPSHAVRKVLSDHGWTPGATYTLPGNLEGHVARLG